MVKGMVVMRIFTNRMILLVILMFGCFLSLIGCGKDSGKVSNDNETESNIALQLQLEKVVPPEKVIKCLNDMGAMTIAHNLRDLESVSGSEVTFDRIQIMEPFVIYTLQQDETFNYNSIYYFPVVSGQEVLFTLDVFLTDTGDYQCSSSANGERLTQFIGDGVCNRVYVDGGTDAKAGEYNIISVESDTRNIQTDLELTKQNIKVLLDVSDTVLSEYEKIRKNEG